MNNMDMKTLTLIIVTFFTLIFANEVTAEEMVSVKLKNYIGNTSKVTFRLEGHYLTLNPTLELKEGEKYTLSFKKGKMILSHGKSKTEVERPFVLYPNAYDEKHLIYINGRPYMGAVAFQVEKKKFVRPVNQLLLEDYLKGVVPFEVFPDWNIEALKAQTLAARTYTITHINSNLDDTIQYQVYGGYNQFPNTTKAVMETKGEIITFKDKPISAFYSASNGGMTESDEHVWGGRQSPYFTIKKDPYDPIQPWNFTLHKTQIDLAETEWDDWDDLIERDKEISSSIKKWLKQNGYDGEIKILSIPHFAIDNVKNESQRSLIGSIQVEFMHRLIDGTVFFERVTLDNVELKKIRPMIGGSTFRSYLISSFESNASFYKVTGKGFGHGVGMSQWGANEMAEKGKNYKEIIEHYYPGTEIKSP